MPIIETVLRRRIPVDPAAPVIPRVERAWGDIRRIEGAPSLPPPKGHGTLPTGNGTIPTNIPGAITQWAGPYALPISEISIGAFFAVSQIHHVFDRIMPGAAQLWPANGSGPMWNALAAIAGLSAAIHGVYSAVKIARAKKKPSQT